MDFITTTNLRTQTPALIHSMSQGKSVALIHRSKIIGDLVPRKTQTVDVPSLEKFNLFMDRLGAKLPKRDLTSKQRQTAYHKHLKIKYG